MALKMLWWKRGITQRHQRGLLTPFQQQTNIANGRARLGLRSPEEKLQHQHGFKISVDTRNGATYIIVWQENKCLYIVVTPVSRHFHVPDVFS